MDNFKLGTGTWVAVGAVRAALVDAMEGLVSDAVIVGEGQAEVGALLLLSDKGRAAKAEVLRDRLSALARAATGSASRVARAIILDRAPSFDRGEVTEKGSLNQRALRSHESALIETLFAGGDGTILAG